jgi:hypothetical protein
LSVTDANSPTKRRVLAICADPQILRQLVTTLEGAGAEVDAAPSASAIQNQVIPHRYVFNAWDGNRHDLDVLLPRLRPRAQVAAVVPTKCSLDTMTELISDSRVNHVLVGEKEMKQGVAICAQKLLTGDIFGIEKYLPEGTPVNYVRLRDYAGRSAAIDTILSHAEEVGVRRQVRSSIGQVCEELLMNALYDAPVDEHGNQIFAEVNPHDRTESASPRPVSIRYAATSDTFAVAVRDRFGRLAKDTILAYIRKCLHGSQQIDRKTYGAGLGLYLVANASTAYVVNVAHGIATEVVCMFDRGAKAPLRTIGVFVHPGQAAATGQIAAAARGDVAG